MLCCSQCIPNRTTPRTQEHAVGPENGDHGQSSSNEVVSYLVFKSWDQVPLNRPITKGPGFECEVLGIRLQDLFSSCLCKPTCYLLKSSGCHLHLTHHIPFVEAVFNREEMRMDKGDENWGSEDRWRQIL